MIIQILFSILFLNTFTVADTDYAEQYIKDYKIIAINEMNRTRIPASITLAQGMLESDFGRGELAMKANNHFGIKCGNDWDGGTYDKKDDDRDAAGQLLKSCFRVYMSSKDSYKDHSDFLTNPDKAYRYGFLFNLDSDDYFSWAKGLLEAGYASDKNYPRKLIALIDNYELYKFDKKIIKRINAVTYKPVPKTNATASVVRPSPTSSSVPVKKAQTKSAPKPTTKVAIVTKKVSKPQKRDKAPKEIVVNTSKTPILKKPTSPTSGKGTTVSIDELSEEDGVISKLGTKCVIANEGDTPRLIATRLNIYIDRLLSYNRGIDENFVLKDGDILYLGYKSKNSIGNKTYHRVKKNETMFSISQKYGMDLLGLYKINRIPNKGIPLVGEKVILRRKNNFQKSPKYKMPKEESEEFLFDN